VITVYVWKSRKTSSGKNVGHSSMMVSGHTYISWWPEETAGLGRDYHPIRNQTYEKDVEYEACKPDWAIKLQGLNETAILKWWANFGLVKDGTLLDGPLPPYNITRLNCSTVVAIALKVGDGDKHTPWYATWNTWNIVWTPDDVLQYSLSIQNGLRH